MREVSLAEVAEIAGYSREAVWDVARKFGREPRIYVHWTAGGYNSVYADYHINITGDGRIFASTDDFSDVLAHTYCRNSGAVGISLCCAHNATPGNLGSYPPTAKQIEVCAQVIAAVAKALWLTINSKYVLTHAEAADNIDGIYPHDNYGPFSTFEKWDLLYLGTDESPCMPKSYDDPVNGGNVLRGKANWYANNM